MSLPDHGMVLRSRAGLNKSLPQARFPLPDTGDTEANGRIALLALHAWRRCFEATVNQGRYGYLYLLVGVGTEFVKFGFSGDPQNRLTALKRQLPFEIVMVHYARGSTGTERAIHRSLRPWRASGEWYHFSAEVACAALAFTAMEPVERDSYCATVPPVHKAATALGYLCADGTVADGGDS